MSLWAIDSPKVKLPQNTSESKLPIMLALTAPLP